MTDRLALAETLAHLSDGDYNLVVAVSTVLRKGEKPKFTSTTVTGKRRGRPKGSKNKPKLPVTVTEVPSE